MKKVNKLFFFFSIKKKKLINLNKMTESIVKKVHQYTFNVDKHKLAILERNFPNIFALNKRKNKKGFLVDIVPMEQRDGSMMKKLLNNNDVKYSKNMVLLVDEEKFKNIKFIQTLFNYIDVEIYSNYPTKSGLTVYHVNNVVDATGIFELTEDQQAELIRMM